MKLRCGFLPNRTRYKTDLWDIFMKKGWLETMDRAKLERSRQWLREELDRCTAFWLKYGMDPVNGGVYTCLDRKGEIYSTDKTYM